MKTKDFVTRLGLAIEKELASRRNEDYIINPPQMVKYLSVLDYFKYKCKECHGEMEHTPLVPKEECGDISALFRVFDAHGESIKVLGDILKYCSAFCIDSLTDGRINICATVPNVYVRKDEVDRQKAECQANCQANCQGRTIDSEDLLDDEEFLDDDEEDFLDDDEEEFPDDDDEELLKRWEPVFRYYGV